MCDNEFSVMHVDDKPAKSVVNEITWPWLLVLHTQKDSGLRVNLMDDFGIISSPACFQCMGQDWSQTWPPLLYRLEKQRRCLLLPRYACLPFRILFSADRIDCQLRHDVQAVKGLHFPCWQRRTGDEISTDHGRRFCFHLHPWNSELLVQWLNDRPWYPSIVIGCTHSCLVPCLHQPYLLHLLQHFLPNWVPNYF